MQAEANRELTIKKTEIIVNVPIITWTAEDGQNQTASTIDRPFESMPGFDGNLVHVDADNYVLRMMLQQPNGQQSSMTMIKQGNASWQQFKDFLLQRMNE